MRGDEAIRAWTAGDPVSTIPLDGGLINQTWRVDRGGAGPMVLQRLNTDIFVPEVHHDIDAVTRHLAAHGLPTTRLVPTAAGELWHTDPEGGVWRCLTWVGDRTVTRLADPADARAAGELAARFHAALDDFSWTFRSVRPGAHDTPAHMAHLARAVGAGRGHRLYDAVAPLADQLLGRWASWDGVIPPNTRVVHGDLKIANVRFTGPQATCLVDLDTLQHGSLQIELGDALRSWCNTASEDAVDALRDLDLLGAALTGYAAGAREREPTEQEWASLLPGLERISLELAARFARDALEESYFGWNPRFGGRGEHNLLRARGQLSLAAAARSTRVQAEQRLARARRG